ncbi:Flagellar hook capping protein [Beijerinckiaceae bacterium RH AL1]|jgi:flagellar basal-body rod modification protein FlgD|nr:flagellar hook assembly protein FlgD [Beijerinckiaceae bacterium]VVB43208.1 Flagellar hook capping protein [Beijerinckiaceae bacterium RH AL8]VVB43223.1 Flagellar hook capping protein [Beijerinckiaceae bacterium RH CH11]VVC53725.1 Flagellar hook capping protein [Beijerinckiaceae bacterium RH AL1]
MTTSTMTVPNAAAATTSSTSATASSGTAAAAASATVDYNSFLKLLVAELQNQDPTNPTDPTQYLSQIASFSAVGQTVQTNTKLDTMITNNALQQADTAIGRTVTSADGTITGKVSSASIGSDGTITATLANGQTLALGSGVTFS